MLNHNHTEHDCDSTSFDQHRRRNFKFKIFSNKLLTLSLLKVWQLNLYSSDICLLCNNSQETLQHLWSYFFTHPLHVTAINKVANLLHSLVSESQPSSSLTLSDISTLMHEQQSFLYRGLVPCNLQAMISSAVGSVTIADHCITQSFNLLYYELFTNVWKPRCKVLIDFERSHNITLQQKHSTPPNLSRTSWFRDTSLLYQPPSSHIPDWIKWFSLSITQSRHWSHHIFSPLSPSLSSPVIPFPFLTPSLFRNSTNNSV